MRTAPQTEWLGRVGYAARGAVFLILGFFAALAAIGSHARPLDSKGALRLLLAQPFGGVLLAAIGSGLLCFAAWRAAQALADVDGWGSDLKGLARRAVYGITALFYASFGFVALSMLVSGDGGGGGDRAARGWTAWLLAEPAGKWVVAAIGVAIVATGIGIGVAGMRAEFRRRLDLAAQPRWLVTVLGTAGYLTRALVFTLLGIFLVFAALDANSREARGVAGALRAIQELPHGAILLGLTAAGLVAFGLFEIAEAAFRRIAGRHGAAGRKSWMRV